MQMIFDVFLRVGILLWISSQIEADSGVLNIDQFSRLEQIRSHRIKRADEIESQGSSSKSDLKCTLPDHTSDKSYTVTCRSEKNCTQRPRDKVPELAYLQFRCNHGFGYDHMPSRAYCINGTWVPSIGKCKRICPKLVPDNVDLTCYRTQTSLSVPCSGSLVQGMVVRIQCAPHHHIETPVLYNEITCQSSGTWSYPLYRCVPDCGKPHAVTTKLISSGKPDNFGDSPWNAAVYDVSNREKPDQICGGTIISPHLIVSAAHCFFDDNNRKLFSSKNYEIAVAKIKRDYAFKDNSETAFYKINEIILSDSGYNGPLTDYTADIAILRTEKKINISSAVLPACLQLDNFQRFDPGKEKLGKLVGWGYDSKNNPSDILLTADIPFISRSECLKMVNVDFQSSVSLDKFCAGSSNVSGPGAKPGDSGGGLVYRDPQSGLYFLRGVVSIKDPSTQTSLAAFTDISFYVDWISKTYRKIEKVIAPKN